MRDFHPLVFFYSSAALLATVGIPPGRVRHGPPPGSAHDITTPTIVLVALMFISGFQSLLFAMWFDMDDNRER